MLRLESIVCGKTMKVSDVMNHTNLFQLKMKLFLLYFQCGIFQSQLFNKCVLEAKHKHIYSNYARILSNKQFRQSGRGTNYRIVLFWILYVQENWHSEQVTLFT